MKPLPIILYLLFFSTIANAKNYYISSTGNDVNDGLTISTPWQTIKKVNSFTFAANDSILFNRGDVFYGGVIVPRANLSFGAYGTGAKPVITGLSTVTGWVSIGGNLYEAVVSNVKSTVNLVLRNSAIQQIGRYPNAGSSNGGYLVISSGTTTSLTGPALSSVTNWTGAEVVVKVVRWDIQRRTVTSHSAGVLGFAALSSSAAANFGYFFQRDSRTLDVDGEWWYDNVNSKIRVYSTTSPSTYNYQIATVDTLFKNVYGTVSLTNVDFNGSGTEAIYNSGGTAFTITGCNVNNSGKEAITSNSADHVLVTGCTVKNSLGSAIRINTPFSGLKYLTATNNTVDSTCLIAGMEASDGINGGPGILVNGGDSVIVTNNVVTNSGYNGIEWKGSQAHIKYNYVNNYCTVRSDGSGIYTVENGNNSLIVPRNTREVISNICTNGIGNHLGSPDTYNTSCNGLYFDLGTRNVIIDSNTCAYNAGGAFHGNNNDSLYFRNNTFFGNNKSYSFQRFADAFLVREIVIKKNIVYPYRFEYRNLGINLPTLITKEAEILAMGTIDSNYYSLRSGTDTSLEWLTQYSTGTNGASGANNFSYLTGKVGIETHSINFANTGTLEYNASNKAKVVSFSGISKKDALGNVYNNSVTIPAWGSKVLIVNGTTVINQAPSASAGIDKIITVPTDTTTLTGSGTDLDGTISNYAWIQLSGPSLGTITTSNAATTTLTKLVQGVYQYELTVIDNSGASGKDTLSVTVNAPVDQTLKADAGTDISLVLPINSTTLKGSATGTITSYTWTKILGPEQFTIANPNNPSTQISNLAMGQYVFQFKVINNVGDSAFANINLTVTGVLPVTLIDFTAKNNNEKIALQWEVASEINVSYYAIERSNDGQNFENIGEVNANNLLNIQINYNYKDNSPLKGVNYYRLVMIDKDGTINFSKTLSINVKNVTAFTIQNLSLSRVNTNIKMSINSNYQQLLHVVVTDVSGVILFTNLIKLQKGFNAIEKKIPAINTGIYYVNFFTSDQTTTKALLCSN